MKEKFQRFMMGRYGADGLSKIYIAVAFILLIVSMFSKLNIIYILAMLILVYTYYRMFSRNIPKMYAQNQKYLNLRYKIAAKWGSIKKHWAQRKEFHFYKCPKCKQKIRVPKGKGKICITCPKCRTEFEKKS